MTRLRRSDDHARRIAGQSAITNAAFAEDVFTLIQPSFYWPDMTSFNVPNAGVFGQGSSNRFQLASGGGIAPVLGQPSPFPNYSGKSALITHQAANAGYLSTVVFSACNAFVPTSWGNDCPWSAAIIVQTSNKTNGQRLLSSRNSTGFQNIFNIDIDTSGNVSFVGFAGASNAWSLTSSGVDVSDGRPHLVSVSVARGGNGASVRLFVDGVQRASGTKNQSWGTTANPIVIGRDQRDNGSIFAGKVSDPLSFPFEAPAALWLRLYNRLTGTPLGHPAIPALGTSVFRWYDPSNLLTETSGLIRLPDMSANVLALSEAGAGLFPSLITDAAGSGLHALRFDGSNDRILQSITQPNSLYDQSEIHIYTVVNPVRSAGTTGAIWCEAHTSITGSAYRLLYDRTNNQYTFTYDSDNNVNRFSLNAGASGSGWDLVICRDYGPSSGASIEVRNVTSPVSVPNYTATTTTFDRFAVGAVVRSSAANWFEGDIGPIYAITNATNHAAIVASIAGRWPVH